MKKYILLLTLFMIATGCTALRDIADARLPSVSYSSMSIQDLSFDRVTLLFDFDVDNPNPVGLTADRYSYEFFINENSFLTGSGTENVRISRESVSTFSVPVSLNFTEVYNTFSTIFDDDTFAYKIDTEVQFDIPGLGMQRLPVNAAGTLPLPKAPKFEFGGFDVKNLSLSGADMEVNIDVTNNNVFPISLLNASYQLEVNGRDWLDTTLSEPFRLLGSESSRLTIPISLSASQMGSVLFEMMRGSTELEYRLTGSANIGAEVEGHNFMDNIPLNLSGIFRK